MWYKNYQKSSFHTFLVSNEANHPDVEDPLDEWIVPRKVFMMVLAPVKNFLFCNGQKCSIGKVWNERTKEKMRPEPLPFWKLGIKYWAITISWRGLKKTLKYEINVSKGNVKSSICILSLPSFCVLHRDGTSQKEQSKKFKYHTIVLPFDSSCRLTLFISLKYLLNMIKRLPV